MRTAFLLLAWIWLLIAGCSTPPSLTLEPQPVLFPPMPPLPMAAFAPSPTGLKTLTLYWDHSVSTNTVNYIVYHGDRSGVYTNSLTIGYVTNVLYQADPSFRHYFAVTATGPDGESVFSNEVSWPPIPKTNVAIHVLAQFHNGSAWQNSKTMFANLTNPPQSKLFFRVKRTTTKIILQSSGDLKTWAAVTSAGWTNAPTQWRIGITRDVW